MKKVLLWVWQLPQNLAGWLISRWSKSRLITDTSEDQYTVYFYKKFFGSGVSLGDYIILESSRRNIKTIHHEHGHQKQSRMLGPLYLIVIGLPSLLGNIYSRIFHKSCEWYYRQPWEAWADKLGGVER